jgi:hypothetical protein
MEGLLTEAGVTSVYHYAPLHYLLFISRSKALFSKTELRRLGYDSFHFRSTSRRQDEARGFSNYVHLTLSQFPPILKAKLQAGFPHFEITIPAEDVERMDFHLCRFNIAKSRYLRRQQKIGPPENPENGRYYVDKQLPTAETEAECRALLAKNFGRRMIEVLVPVKLPLSDKTSLIFFDSEDAVIAKESLSRIGLEWNIQLAPNSSYARHPRHAAKVREFLRQAEKDENWRGDGLDFDRF